MSFDFMKDFMMFEDEERFAGLCEQIEDAIREVDGGDGKVSELEIMQALDYVGFSLFRDNWEEYKKMDMMNREQPYPTSFQGKDKKFWFGGGCDLTPMVEDEKAKNIFHFGLKEMCNKHDKKYYKRFKLHS